MSELVASQNVLGILAETPVYGGNGRIYTHMSFGRVVDALAPRYKKVLVCCPVLPQNNGTRDYEVASSNVELLPQPCYGSSMGAITKVGGIVKAYHRLCRRADHIFVRGMLPYAGAFYLLARISGRRPCHWIVGDPVALLKSHRRGSRLKDALSLAYARQDRFFTRAGRWLSGGSLMCNGDELARTYRSPRTQAVVSSTVTDDEFFVRDDTCQNPEVRVLFISFVRPEKGVEYLVQALPMLKTSRPCRLTIVGTWKGYEAYKARLDQLIDSLGLHGRVDWRGYASYGPAMWEYLRSHDIFVLPTLSEGTPHVLTESRANSLPVVATRVGGIPSSVTDGVDGLLVEPKNPAAIADAIDRIVEDGPLRRNLIRGGLATARSLTLERFVDKIVLTMNDTR